MNETFRRAIALELIEYLENDSDILRLAEKTNYDLKVCQNAIPLLNFSESVFFLVEKTNSYYTVAKEAINVMESESNILALMEQLEFGENVCEIGVPLLNIPGKSFEKLLEWMRRSGYKRKFCQEVFAHLSQEQKDWSIDFFKESGHQKTIGNLVAPYLRSRKDTLFVMKKTKYDWQVCKRIDLSLLESEEEIIWMLNKTRGNSFVWMYNVYPFLSLETKTDDELLGLIEATGRDGGVARDCVEHMSDPNNIWVATQMCHFELLMCEVATPLLDSRERVFEAMKVNKYHWRISYIGMNWVNGEEEALWLLKKSKYNNHVAKAAIPWLSYENLKFLMRCVNYDYEVVNEVIPYLHLKNKTNRELINIIKESGFKDPLPSKIVPFINFERQTKQEVIELIKESEFDYSVCRKASNYLKKLQPEEA